jgi:RND family efflux transporter MFP subunit
MTIAQSSTPGNGSNAGGRRVWVIVGVASALLMALTAALQLGWLAAAEPEAAAAKGPQSIPVRVAVAARSSLTLRARYVGELDADAAELSSQVTGKLEAVTVDIGDSFEQGKLLARIDSAQAEKQVAEARAQVRAAEAAKSRVAAQRSAATVELERGERLLAGQLIAAQEVDARRSELAVLDAEAEAADAQAAQTRARVAVLQEQLRQARLVAPFDGAVSQRHLNPGALVQPGSMILRLVRAGPSRVRFRVAERDLGRIHMGAAFELTTQATGPRRFSGKITGIAAEISREDRSALVLGVLDAESEALRSGMYAEVELGLGALENAVVVPSAAVVERHSAQGTRQGLYVAENGKARFVVVKVLGQADDLTAVEGIQTGARVVTLGHEGLKDGAGVRVDAPRDQ